MKFELHCHSFHSRGRKIPWEGLASPGQMVRTLKKLGFGGFALTDHNTIAGWHEARKEAKKQGMVFIPGSEISTGSGHFIALGINEAVSPGLSVEETGEIVHDQGGITIAPHPLDIRGEGIGKKFVLADAVEIFNSLNLTRIENRLAKKGAKKLGVPGVGGSDAHSLAMLGMTANHIDAHDMDTVLKHIKKGKVKIEGRYVPVPVVVAWTRERMKRSYDDVEKYIAKNYHKPKSALARFLLKRFVNSESIAWNALGAFSVNVSKIYSLLRLATV